MEGEVVVFFDGLLGLAVGDKECEVAEEVNDDDKYEEDERVFFESDKGVLVLVDEGVIERVYLFDFCSSFVLIKSNFIIEFDAECFLVRQHGRFKLMNHLFWCFLISIEHSA